MSLQLQRRAVPFQLKEISQAGEFSGYASVFDVLDYYSDVIRKGAFEKSLGKWAGKGKLPPLLWQHKSDIPLGPHTLMREDDKGLYVEGRLLIKEIPKAAEAHALLLHKVISGMSIGFDYGSPPEYDGKTNVWNILEVDLWENSLATFPANEEAQVEAVKSKLVAGTLPTLSEFEDLLRDVGGFSRKQAKTIAACGFKSLLRDADGEPLRDAEDEKAIDLSDILNYVKRTGT